MIDSIFNWLFGDIWIIFLILAGLILFASRFLLNSKVLQGVAKTGVGALLERFLNKK